MMPSNGRTACIKGLPTRAVVNADAPHGPMLVMFGSTVKKAKQINTVNIHCFLRLSLYQKPYRVGYTRKSPITTLGTFEIITVKFQIEYNIRICIFQETKLFLSSKVMTGSSTKLPGFFEHAIQLWKQFILWIIIRIQGIRTLKGH